MNHAHATPNSGPNPTPNQSMIDGQLRPNRITSAAVVAAFTVVNRASFVPENKQVMAHAETAINLAHGRTMHQPMVVGHLVQALGLMGTEHVLVCAANTGYSAALLAFMLPNGKVIALEDSPELFTHAQKNLSTYKNVQVVAANPAAGHAAGAPYAAILIDAVVAHIPPALVAQVAEGGKLAALVQGADGLPEVCIFTRHSGVLVQESLFETAGEVHPAFARAQTFVF